MNEHRGLNSRDLGNLFSGAADGLKAELDHQNNGEIAVN